MIDEKVLLERLEEETQYVDLSNPSSPVRCVVNSINPQKIIEIVNQLAEEHNKKYEPTMDLIEHGVDGYNHHLQEQYKKGYAEGWHDCSCTIQQSAPYQPKGE